MRWRLAVLLWAAMVLGIGQTTAFEISARTMQIIEGQQVTLRPDLPALVFARKPFDVAVLGELAERNGLLVQGAPEAAPLALRLSSDAPPDALPKLENQALVAALHIDLFDEAGVPLQQLPAGWAMTLSFAWPAPLLGETLQLMRYDEAQGAWQPLATSVTPYRSAGALIPILVEETWWTDLGDGTHEPYVDYIVYSQLAENLSGGLVDALGFLSPAVQGRVTAPADEAGFYALLVEQRRPRGRR